MKKMVRLLLAFICTFSLLCGCTVEIVSDDSIEQATIIESGTYTSKEEVAEYIHTYDHLPDNYITKKEAKNLGWDNSKGNLWDVADGMSIGGDYFGNYDENLPVDTEYHECDIDYEGGYRNSKRIVYGEDGSIYYTEDHYETFEELY